jgi:hypothetical protein
MAGRVPDLRDDAEIVWCLRTPVGGETGTGGGDIVCPGC